jgi:hypothetical protein
MDPIAQTLTEIESEAVAKAGCSDFGSTHYRGFVEAWVRDLLAPELNEIGRAFMRRLAFNALVRRLRVLALLRAQPEIAAVALPPIVLISGLPRTGTTLAHNLIALHAQARALLRWELMDPLPPPEAASYASDPRIAKVQRAIEPLRGSLLEHLHWVNADEPEECVWGYLDGTSMLGRAAMAVMPAWREQLRTSDPRPTFREYRALLQLLLWHHPLPPDGVLVLKCPQIAGALSAFAEVFPEARYVLAHRDPYRALLSSSTMLQAINAPFTSAPPRMRREQDDWLARTQAHGLDHMVQFSGAVPEQAVQLHYPELLDDGPAACERVLTALGLPHDAGFEPRARAFLERQRAGQRAQPPAAYDDFGYDHDLVLADPLVARYCRHFGVAAERQRRTGT